MIQPKACSSRPRKPWGARRFTTHGQAYCRSASSYMPRLRAGSPAKPTSSHQRRSRKVFGWMPSKISPPCLSWAALETPRPHVWPHPMSPKHFAAPRRSTWPTRRSSRLKLLRAKLKCPEAAPSDCGETSPRRATRSVHAPMPEDVALRRLFGPKTAVHSAQGLFS
jgi:hypothetical protein